MYKYLQDQTSPMFLFLALARSKRDFSSSLYQHMLFLGDDRSINLNIFNTQLSSNHLSCTQIRLVSDFQTTIIN